MTCPIAPKRGHRPGSKASLTCPYCNPDHPGDSHSLLSDSPSLLITTESLLDHHPTPPIDEQPPSQPVDLHTLLSQPLAPSVRARKPRKRREDRRTKLREHLLPTADARPRARLTTDLDSFADELESETASRGKKANWLCPSLTDWANHLEGSIFASLTESQLRAELIRRHCPLWLAKSLAAGTFELLPKLASVIGRKASVSVVLRLLAVWVCPIQDACTPYQENIFKLTFESILAKSDPDTQED